MVFWIGLGILVVVFMVMFSYSAVTLASRDDDFMEECFRKQQEELLKEEEEK